YGDYSFRLNDSRISMKRDPNAATVLYAELKTKRDWSQHPPVLHGELDLDDPQNSGYIVWARANGRLRSENEEDKDQAEMANAAVVTQLLEQNQKLTDQVIKKDTPPAPSVVNQPQPKAEPGDGGALKAVADLAIAVLNRPATVAPAADPMVMVK